VIDQQTITEVLTLLLPEDAELQVIDEFNEYQANFCWPLKNDPNRPHKRSKMVQLKIQENAMLDLTNVGNKLEAKTLIDLETYLKSQLYEFEPDHQTPKGLSEPIEKWEISSLHFLTTLKPHPSVKRRLF
jgi:hypothetical protein